MSLFPLRLIPHTTNFNFMRVRWVSIGIAALLVIAAIYVFINLVIDLIYMLVDPRVRV